MGKIPLYVEVCLWPLADLQSERCDVCFWKVSRPRSLSTKGSLDSNRARASRIALIAQCLRMPTTELKQTALVLSDDYNADDTVRNCFAIAPDLLEPLPSYFINRYLPSTVR